MVENFAIHVLGLGMSGARLLGMVMAFALVAAVVVVIVLQSREDESLQLFKGLDEVDSAPMEQGIETDIEMRLRELKELHAQEILTDEEFSTKKKELLSL